MPSKLDAQTKERIRRNREKALQTLEAKRRGCRPAALLWFRGHDLRLADNPALHSLLRDGFAPVPCFIFDQRYERASTAPSSAKARASELWRKESLRALKKDLEELGSTLVLRSGATTEVLASLARESRARVVYYNRVCEPSVLALDASLGSELARKQAGQQQQQQLRLSECHNAAHLYEPAQALEAFRREQAKRGGRWHGHFGTLMPFLRVVTSHCGAPRRPLPGPSRPLPRPGGRLPVSRGVDELGMAVMPTRRRQGRGQRSKQNQEGGQGGGNGEGDAAAAAAVVDWGRGIRKGWAFGERAAQSSLRAFLSQGLEQYERDRSRVDLEGAVSRLSPYLRHGELSPHTLYWAVEDRKLGAQVKTFRRRLFWRDLAYYHLSLFPSQPARPIRAHYANTRWREDAPALLRRWRAGYTGFPLVDAGMRELRETGWMQQNVRMVCASFLVEFMGVSWARGFDHFHDFLVDADVAINSMMWQNAGRCGIDQWNFVLRPENGKSRDPTGAYVRKWVPELARLPTKHLHAPWAAPVPALARAGVAFEMVDWRRCRSQDGSGGERGDGKGAGSGVGGARLYPQRMLTDLDGARRGNHEAVLAMRRGALHLNDKGGYDLIAVPTPLRPATRTMIRLFTRKGFRLDASGRLLRVPAAASSGGRRRGRGGGAAARKAGGGRRAKAKPPSSRKSRSLVEMFAASGGSGSGGGGSSGGASSGGAGGGGGGGGGDGRRRKNKRGAAAAAVGGGAGSRMLARSGSAALADSGDRVVAAAAAAGKLAKKRVLSARGPRVRRAVVAGGGGALVSWLRSTRQGAS